MLIVLFMLLYMLLMLFMPRLTPSPIGVCDILDNFLPSSRSLSPTSRFILSFFILFLRLLDYFFLPWREFIIIALYFCCFSFYFYFYF
jgi:hypothetical protein